MRRTRHGVPEQASEMQNGLPVCALAILAGVAATAPASQIFAKDEF